MKHGTIIFAVLAHMAVATAAFAALPSVESTTLKNGLRIVLAPDPDARAVDVAVWYATGSRLEQPGRSGITHLFERLMFHGTEAAGADFTDHRGDVVGLDRELAHDRIGEGIADRRARSVQHATVQHIHRRASSARDRPQFRRERR